MDLNNSAMRLILPVLFLLILSTASLCSYATEAKRALPGATQCPIDLPKTAKPWTAAEQYAWQQICLGRMADMRYAKARYKPDDLPCRPDEIKSEIPMHRQLRPEFLQLVLTREPWVKALAKPQVNISCAVITDKLDFENEHITPEFYLYGSKVEGEVFLLNASFVRSLYFSNSQVVGKFNANGMEVGGDFFMQGDASFQAVDLLGAKIRGSISANGSSFMGKFNADRMEVGGGLFMRQGASFQDEVRLLGAKIRGDVSAGGSSFTGKFTADGMEVGGGLFMREGASFQAVDLLGAKILGDISANGSSFMGKFNADRMEVGGSLFMRGGASFQAIELGDVTIKNGLQLQGSTFSGEVGLTGLEVGGDLRLSSPSSQPTWSKNAQLLLRNAAVGAIQAQEAAWVREDGSLLPTDLTGFRYRSLGGLNAHRSQTLADSSAAWLTQWIAAQPDHDRVYDPQPYQQLADVLERAGAMDKAKAIRYARYEHKRAVDDLAWADSFGLLLSKWVIGYGVYPFRALWWFAGLIVLGWLLLLLAARDRIRGVVRCFWFSVENALPLVELTQSHKDVRFSRAWVESFFHLQKILGFILATVLVGALTLVGG